MASGMVPFGPVGQKLLGGGWPVLRDLGKEIPSSPVPNKESWSSLDLQSTCQSQSGDETAGRGLTEESAEGGERGGEGNGHERGAEGTDKTPVPGRPEEADLGETEIPIRPTISSLPPQARVGERVRAKAVSVAK